MACGDPVYKTFGCNCCKCWCCKCYCCKCCGCPRWPGYYELYEWNPYSTANIEWLKDYEVKSKATGGDFSG